MRKMSALVSCAVWVMGLSVIDASVVLPRKAALQLSSEPQTLAVSGSTVFVGVGSNMEVLDLHNPSTPQKTTSLKFPADVKVLLVNGHLLYVGLALNSGPELFILNISQPSLISNANIVGSLELNATPSSSDGFHVEGSVLYMVFATSSSGKDAVAVDVSNPATPVMRGGVSLSGPVYGVHAQGTTLWVAKENVSGGNTFWTFDCTNPDNWIDRGSVSLGKLVRSYYIDEINNSLLVGNYDGSSIRDLSVVNINQLRTPALMTTHTVLGRSRAVASYGTWGIAGSDANTGFEVHLVDLSSPTNSAVVGGAEIGANVNALALVGNSLVVGSWNNSVGNIQVFDAASIIEPDGTAPHVELIAPIYSQLSGTILLRAVAQDNWRVSKVQLLVNQIPRGSAVPVQGMNEDVDLPLNTTLLSEGPVVLSVEATDIAGNKGLSSAVTVQINNNAGDKIPPTVSWTLPQAQETIRGPVLLHIAATDNVGVVGVQFKVDGKALGVDVTTSPYRVRWNSEKFSDGPHVLSAVVRDAAGNSTPLEDRSVSVDNSRTWAKQYPALREFFVSPAGQGKGTSLSDPMSAMQAIKSAQPGDHFWFTSGVYPKENWDLQKGGTAGHPVVFRAYPGHRVTVPNQIKVMAPHIDVWGLEVTDPQDAAFPTAIIIYSANVRLINNIVMDGTGIAPWNTGPGQVIYGNIVFGSRPTPLKQRGHLVYTQNNFQDNGYKYFVQNMFLSPAKNACNLRDNNTAASDCYAFHAYTEGGFIQGFVLEENTVSGGSFLIGGYNQPSHSSIVKNNYFYGVRPQIGYARPTQMEFSKNYIAQKDLILNWWWGQGEVTYKQRAPMIFSGNEILSRTQIDALVRTSAYTPARVEGVVPMNPTDEMDRNVYTNGFRGTLAVNGQSYVASSLTQWADLGLAQGKLRLDGSSKVVPFPTETKTVVFKNEFEPKRAQILIFNWAKQAHVSVDVSSILSAGDEFYVMRATQPFGPLWVSSVYSGGSIDIPTKGEEFLPLILAGKGGAFPIDDVGSDLSSQTGFSMFNAAFNSNKDVLKIRFTLSPSQSLSSESVELMIYDRRGNKIQALNSSQAVAINNEFELVWDGTNSSGSKVAAGTYTLLLKIGGKTSKKNVVVVK